MRLLERRQADSNCCTSFCRALPSHSAMTPKTDANLTKKTKITSKKRSYYFFSRTNSFDVFLSLCPLLPSFRLLMSN